MPERVWVINELTNEELGKLDVSLDFDDDKERWWEQHQLTVLNLSSNSLKELDSRVRFLGELNVLDVRRMQYNSTDSHSETECREFNFVTVAR